MTRRATDDGSSGDARRPLALSAAAAGLAAAGAVQAVCMAVALAGWFAADAGRYGDTRDALRVGADAWLLGHGSSLQLEQALISVVPLGLTLLCAYVTFRLGRWAGETSAVGDLSTALTGAVVLSGFYGVVATVTAVLASEQGAEPSLGRAFVGAALLSLFAGGAGIIRGSDQRSVLRERTPDWLLAVTTGAVSLLMLVVAASAILVAVALLLDFGTAANVVSRLQADTPGALLYLTVVLTFVPNAVLLGGAYLLGPGFSVGTGTLVSPAAVVLGPVPAFPLLAALPDDGVTPWWTTWLAALPVLLAVVAAVMTIRRYPVVQYELGALRGLSTGVLAGVVLGGLVALAGGSAGPGRMSQIGAPLAETLLAATVALGVGGLIGGVAGTWWARRRFRRSTAGSTPDTLSG